MPRHVVAAPILIGVTAVTEPGTRLRHALDLALRLTPAPVAQGTGDIIPPFRAEAQGFHSGSRQDRKQFDPVQIVEDAGIAGKYQAVIRPDDVQL
jgi:hypothetical protein